MPEYLVAISTSALAEHHLLFGLYQLLCADAHLALLLSVAG